MGGVLVDFNPSVSLRKYFTDEKDIMLLLEQVFKGTDWAELDRGTLTVDEAVERACARIPVRLHAGLRRMLENWADEMPPFNDMLPLVQELKNNGYGIYLLSNAPLNFGTYRDRIPAFALFDGFIVSSDHLCLKPEPKIYEILFKTFSLDPDECFFIDDLPVNIEGAAAMGMKGHCFDHGSPAILRNILCREGILKTR